MAQWALDLAALLINFSTYGLLILIILFVWELLQIGRNTLWKGAKGIGLEQASKSERGGILGGFKQTGSDIKKLVIGEEKAILASYYTEKKLLVKLREANEEAKKGKSVDKPIKKAKNMLNGRLKKLTSRLSKLTVKIAGLENDLKTKRVKIGTLDANVTNLEILNKKIIDQHGKLSDKLGEVDSETTIPSKKKKIEEAITIENGIIKDISSMLAVEKAIEES